MNSPFQPRPFLAQRKVRPVTIVLGFTCKDGIVLACDSQLSDPESTRKQTGVAKLARVMFSDGAVLIGKAGSVWLTNYFHELFEEKASKTSLAGPRSVADLAEQTMKEAKARFIDAFLPEQPTSEAIQQRVRDYAYVVMIAFHCQGRPHIFTLSSYAGIAVRETHAFSAAGCGDSLASYVLTGIDTASLSAKHAMALAAYTVETCKQHDAGCGGNVQLGIIAAEDGRCALSSGKAADPYVNAAILVSASTPADTIKRITTLFDEHAFLYFNEDGSRK